MKVPLKRFFVLPEKADATHAKAQAELVRLGLIEPGAEVLGSGSFGDVVRSRTPGRVVKLTDDKDEAESATRVMRGGAKYSQGLPQVYSVEKLTLPGDSVWAIELEELQPLSSSEKEKLDAILTDSGYMAFDDSGVLRSELAKGLGQEIWSQEPRLKQMIWACIQLGITPDLHFNNVMKRRDGTWVLADLGPINLD